MKNILCSISTKGRYDTTLPLTINAIIHQTLKVDKLIIFDDNDSPIDLREIQLYRYLFSMLDQKNISWEVIFGQKKGQHYNHQHANSMGYTWVWRVDDDCIPEPNVLEKLYKHTADDIGGIAGSILTPPIVPISNSTGKIENIDKELNLQWDYVQKIHNVEHLHCSFLYRSGIHNYNLNLSKVAHREETLFTYGLYQKGYRLLVIPNAITWHLRNQFGGIRTEVKDLFDHDEHIFRNTLNLLNYTVVVLDCGMGDHIVFKKILPEIKNPLVFTCYPDIVPGKSLDEAKKMLINFDEYNIYKKMDQWNWTDSLENAFRKLYIK